MSHHSRDEIDALAAKAAGRHRESQRIGEILRKETIGGFILLGATIAALILANSPWSDAYFGLRDVEFGFDIGEFHLTLTLGHWASSGLLAIFFFLTGLELKKEFVVGELRNPKLAAVPVAAAFGGVAVPALIYTFLNRDAGGDILRGWAVPTATDIAFAVAVLAIVGTSLPSAMRMFLLTLAVVDDLIAITIIAIFYTEDINLLFLGLAFIPFAIFGVLAHRATIFLRMNSAAAWLVLLPIGIVGWALLYNSGVHATIAGVILGFLVPVRPSRASGEVRIAAAEGDASRGLSEMFEHRFRPLSTGIAIPVFAFFSAGVAVGDLGGLWESITSEVAVGIIVGLVVGKSVGITLTTFIVTRFKAFRLNASMKWIDVFGLAMIGGIGFTVALLVGELSFGLGSEHDDDAKIGILTGSLLAAVLGGFIVALRNRHYKRQIEFESRDEDEDGIPDYFQRRT